MPKTPVDSTTLESLFERFESQPLGDRLRVQVDFIARLFGRGRGGIHFENLDFLFPFLDWGLRLAGLKRRATENVLAHQINHHVFFLPGLPPAFSGLRILHLSDLHIDCQDHGIADLGRYLARVVEPLQFDLCVITGDFRYKTHGSYDRVFEQMADLAPSLSCEYGVYGILGNHDFIEQVPLLEQLGIRMLINESVPITMDDQQLWLMGLDDPHFYGTNDLVQARAQAPGGACLVALIHSPELVDEAQRAGVSLYLTGHTHGGQLCLPGGAPLYINANCPRRFNKGRWQQGALQGYTSSGTGSSGLAVRLNCPPEVAIHELRC